jgi:hypothetical protein
MEGLAVAVIGWALGSAELLSRYKDAPYAALRTLGGWTYILANVLAGLLALALIHGLRPDFAFPAVGQADPVFGAKWWTRVLVAGLGAMAFFRSSLFTIRVGNAEVQGGPAFIFQVLLDVADRDVDRTRAKVRARLVVEIMKDIDFNKAKGVLPSYSFALMQHITSEEQSQFNLGHTALVESKIDQELKVLTLGLSLMNLVGEDVLRMAVDNLRRRIIRTEIADIVKGLSFHEAAKKLPSVCFSIAKTKVEDKSSFDTQLKLIEASNLTNDVKLVTMVHALAEIVDTYTIETAVAILGQELRHSPSPAALQ